MARKAKGMEPQVELAKAERRLAQIEEGIGTGHMSFAAIELAMEALHTKIQRLTGAIDERN